MAGPVSLAPVGGRVDPVPPRELLRGWVRTIGSLGEPASARDAVGMLLLYGAAIAAWCAGLTLVEAALGLPLSGVEDISTGPNYLDALWHVATALLVALPFRNKRAYVLLPLFSLGLDSDHVFAAIFPTPFAREGHDLLFLGLATVAFLLLGSRFLAWLTAAGWLVHVAVDGGDFPLFAPFTPADYSLAYPFVAVMIGAAFLSAFLALRPMPESWSPRAVARAWGPPVAALAALLLILYWIAPGFSGFTSW